MTRETLMFKFPFQTQDAVKERLDRFEQRIGRKRFAKKFKSITVDNGAKFLDWLALEKSCLARSKTRTQIYYCHPYSAWERGSNEQRNGHIRRFILKASDISRCTHKRIKEIEDWLNNSPRRILKGMSARDRLKQLGLAA